jgi:hypothetical protein
MSYRGAIWRTARFLLGVLVTATSAAQTSAARFSGMVVDPAGQFVAGAHLVVGSASCKSMQKASKPSRGNCK